MTLTQDIRYLGVNDRDIDLFEGQYAVPNGISYNSYVILDEKVAVLDTVDHRKSAEFLVNLERELAGRKVDYLVLNHLEPDHAANIKTFTDKYPSAALVGNAKTFAMLPQFFDIAPSVEKLTVKEGDSLSLGAHTFNFVMAPMVHWPEVMVTYESSEKVLFSADGFGKFGALDVEEDWACEARRYYFNIVGKYGGPVQTLLKKAAALDIKTICPLHGPVLTERAARSLFQILRAMILQRRLRMRLNTAELFLPRPAMTAAFSRRWNPCLLTLKARLIKTEKSA